jgi:hypothetical protein
MRRIPDEIPNPNVLLVEGADDKWIIPELIEANGHRWGEKREPKLVKIEDYGGVEKLLAAGEISTRLNGSNVKHLGIVVDADGHFKRRWSEVRTRFREVAGERVPDEMPADGLVVELDRSRRIGAWIMPDNRQSGMMETFLSWLRPGDVPALLTHAEETCDRARTLGAPYKEAHRDKALIHTWLAWQEEPGRQLHQAIKYRILDPRCPESRSFVRWFERLYGLQPAGTATRGAPE